MIADEVDERTKFCLRPKGFVRILPGSFHTHLLTALERRASQSTGYMHADILEERGSLSQVPQSSKSFLFSGEE